MRRLISLSLLGELCAAKQESRRPMPSNFRRIRTPGVFSSTMITAQSQAAIAVEFIQDSMNQPYGKGAEEQNAKQEPDQSL